MPFSLVIHGGAGALKPSKYSEEEIQNYHRVLGEALQIGKKRLASKGSAVEAMVETVSFLEDSPLFNAGRGSVLASNGEAIMDACVMDGRTRKSGSASLLKKVQNPIQAARAVLEESSHALLAGEEAESFALNHGINRKDPSYFITEARKRQLERLIGTESIEMDHEEPADRMGTVGAMALDTRGHLAAATSTGGMANKHPSRISDSAIPGAGTFADDRFCAISCTGTGDDFIRQVTAKEIADRVRFGEEKLGEATQKVLQDLKELGADGGLIALSPSGDIYMPFISLGMFRGFVSNSKTPQTAIFKS